MSMVIDDELLYACVPQAEQLLMEQLPPEKELKHRFSARFKRKMRALMQYERRTPRMRSVVRGVKVAAAVFVVALSVTLGALMSVEACRTRIIEIITKVFSDSTEVRVSVDDGAPSDRVLRPVAPAYVPEGYEVVEEETSNIDYVITYENEAGKVIDYEQDLLSNQVYLVDTENVYMEEILIGSQAVQVIVKPSRDYCTIYWYDNYYYYWISGHQIESDELLKMAESIILE